MKWKELFKEQHDMKKGLEEQIGIFRTRIKTREDTIQQLNEDINALNENQNAMITEFQKQIQAMKDNKQLMITTVNTTSLHGDEIDKTCDDAVALLDKRLTELGIRDNYRILAIPHTMSIGIVR